MRYVSVLALGLLLAAGCGGSSDGGTTPSDWTTIRHDEARVLIDIPTYWQSEAQPNILELRAPDNALSLLVFLERSAAEVSAALRSLNNVLSRRFDRYQLGEPQNRSFNGMPAIVSTGQGVSGSTTLGLYVAVVVTPSNEALLILGLLGPGATSEDAATADAILESIRPL